MPHNHSDLTLVAGLGRATSCAGYGTHRPKSLRFVWHHILPQVCGGKTEKANLVSLCDSCHYSVHALLWLMKLNGGKSLNTRQGTSLQRALAAQGYEAALAAKTVVDIPFEGSSLSADGG